VTFEQMTTALLAAVENPPRGSNLRERPGVSRCECAKSLASRGVWSVRACGHESPDQSNLLNYESA
jgi:hypothetical protein